MSVRIVIATPHRRYLPLVRTIGERPGFDVLHITDRADLTEERLREFDPAYIFFPHWSWIIPASVHEQFRAVIFHMTDLPYGRGGSPLQNLIRRGHQQTTLSAIECVAELDAGAVYMKRPLSLLGTAEEIFLRAAALMEEMIVAIVEEQPEPQPQQGEPVEFKRLKPADSSIVDVQSLDQLFDRIRMLDAEGYPPAFLKAAGFRFEFSRASLKPGEVLADVRIRIDED